MTQFLVNLSSLLLVPNPPFPPSKDSSFLTAFLCFWRTISHLSSSKCYFTLNLAEAGSAGGSIGSFPVCSISHWSSRWKLASDWLVGPARGWELAAGFGRRRAEAITLCDTMKAQWRPCFAGNDSHIDPAIPGVLGELSNLWYSPILGPLLTIDLQPWSRVGKNQKTTVWSSELKLQRWSTKWR